MVKFSDLSRKSISNRGGVETKRFLVGIETKIKSSDQKILDFLEEWGALYQKIVRWSTTRLLQGKSKNELLPTVQSTFNIDWAWADSILTDAVGIISSAEELRKLNIENIEKDIKSGIEKVEEMISEYKNFVLINDQNGAKIQAFKINNKLRRLERRTDKLVKLRNSKLSITFGTKELARKQHFLSENNFSSHEEWLQGWRLARSGNFSSVGNANSTGKNRVMKTFYKQDNIFILKIIVPKCLTKKYSQELSLEFIVTERRYKDLLYAVDPENLLSYESKQPITVRCFRREHKNNSWYLHFSTYVPEIPTLTHNNGTLGIDLNAKTIDVVYVLSNGNIKKSLIKSFSIPVGTTGKVNASLRNIVNEIVGVASQIGCSISIENLDFKDKKAALRHSSSKKYNRMLSGFVYSKFREFLVTCSEKKGIRVNLINPALTSTIGLFKYTKLYGLSSGFAAALVIGRRALGFNETLNTHSKMLLSSFGFKEIIPRAKSKNWKLWNKVHKKMKESRIHRDRFYERNISKIIIMEINNLKKKSRKSQKSG
jgi:IS605 OrfB family transposase